MALISSGGGRLRVSAPHLPHGIGASTFSGPTPKPPHVPVPHVHAAPKVKTPVVKPPTGPHGAGAAGGADPNDPFTFIKGLLASTDPTQIRGLIDPIYAPIRQEVQNQINQLDATGKARADQMSQVYQAFEQYLGGLPGQIQSIYGQKGAQDGAALAAGMAGPQGDVGSHLQAMSNSDLMSQLGSNWASYAAAQPHIYALMATENIKSMLNATNASEATLRSKLLDLSSQEADAVLKYLESAQAKDDSLQQWAYTQKQSQSAAKASQAQASLNAKAAQTQAYLNYAQKERVIQFNELVATQKLTIAKAKAQSDANYKTQLLQLKQAGLISTEQYHQALIGLGAARVAIADKNATTAATNATTNAGRAATAKTNADRNYQLAKKRYALSEKKYQQTKATAGAKAQDKIVAARNAAANYAKSLQQSNSGSTSTSVWIGPKGQVSTTPVKGWARSSSSSRNARYSKAQVYNMVYRRYAPDLFNYYRQTMPGRAEYQSLIDSAIRLAVGYGPNG